MRTSGRSGSETLMFVAPAAIFGGFFVWMYGGPVDLIQAIDRSVLHGISKAGALCAAALEALSKL